MSDEELSKQITKIAVEIEKVEQTAIQKKTYFTNKCDDEYDPRIRDVGERLLQQQTKLNEILKNLNKLTAEKKELLAITKKLETKYNSLIKEKQKIYNQNIRAIVREKKNKTKDIDNKIKLLEKELKTSEKI